MVRWREQLTEGGTDTQDYFDKSEAKAHSTVPAAITARQKAVCSDGQWGRKHLSVLAVHRAQLKNQVVIHLGSLICSVYYMAQYIIVPVLQNKTNSKGPQKKKYFVRDRSVSKFPQSNCTPKFIDLYIITLWSKLSITSGASIIPPFSACLPCSLLRPSQGHCEHLDHPYSWKLTTNR